MVSDIYWLTIWAYAQRRWGTCRIFTDRVPNARKGKGWGKGRYTEGKGTRTWPQSQISPRHWHQKLYLRCLAQLPMSILLVLERLYGKNWLSQFCARARAQKASSARLSTAPWSIALLPWKPGPKFWKIQKASGLRTWRPCSNQAVTSVWPAAWHAFTCLGMPEQLLQNLSGMQDHSLNYMRRPGGDIDSFHMPSGFCEGCCSSPCLHHFNVG